MKKIYVLLFLLFCNHATAYYFPFVFNSTRPMGMGNAFTAAADDVNSLEYNPAGLAYVEGQNVSFDGNWMEYDYRYYGVFEQALVANYTYGGGKISYARKNIGISVDYRLEGDIKNKTAVDIYDYNQHHWTVVYRSDLSKLLQVSAGYGLEIDRFAFGLNLKAVYFENESLDVGGANNRFVYSFDLGCIYRFSGNFSAGLVLLRKGLNTLTVNYPLQGAGITTYTQFYSLNAGLMYTPAEGTKLAFDIRNILPMGTHFGMIPEAWYTFPVTFHFGIEQALPDNFVLRAGLMEYWRDDDYSGEITFRTEATAGFGIKTRGFVWDIALADDFQTVYNVKYPVQILASFGYNF